MAVKTILVTGNLGYIGSVMVPRLVNEGFKVIGYDCGYYEDCYLVESKQDLVKQIKKDVRDCTPDDFEGVDCVFHLAGLSNDPLGEFDPSLTDDINHKASIKLAECAKQAGVQRFIYTSSQSVYGISDTSHEVGEDDEKNPITAYAKAKWACECDLPVLADENFTIAYLRPATAYGASPNLRCDIVFNGFMANACTTGDIIIKSDGSPWRPMSHVNDIIAAFIACAKAPAELIANQAFNVGTADNNYTVRDMAEIAQKLGKDCSLEFTGEHTDPRSYRVSSKKILTTLADWYKPEWNIERGGEQLASFFDEVGFTDETFTSWKTNRLKCLKRRIENGTVSPEDMRVK